jgi:hypothetical protein
MKEEMKVIASSRLHKLIERNGIYIIERYVGKPVEFCSREEALECWDKLSGHVCANNAYNA